MATITPKSDKAGTTETITVKTTDKKKKGANRGFKWWTAKSQQTLSDQVLATANYLKELQNGRERQASLHARLYGNIPLSNFIGTGMAKTNQNTLPVDRPTMNVVYSCIDTLTSRLTQSKPRPVFLTDNADYKQRNLAKQLNNFIMGEFYSSRAYELGELVLRDAEVLGTGCFKVYETDDAKVGIERVLLTELMVDANEAKYGKPRSLYQFKMIDRGVADELFKGKGSTINNADQATFDTSKESSETTSDQIILVEAWHLPSVEGADDGRHVICCSSGVLLDEPFKKDKFPFAFLHFSPRMLGFWGQGVPEQLMGTQIEINKLLMTISESIALVGVPRVFVEEGSKVVKAQLNDQVGAIVTYRGTKPEYQVAPCVPQELYAQLQRLVEYAFQQCGISQMSAASVKPAGLDSGNAIREHESIQDARFSALQTRYDNVYIDLAYIMIDMAKDIAKRDKKYSTVYPSKDGTREIDLPAADQLENPFIIQCFDSSSLPRDPAGRKQSIIEDMQSGILTPQEGRRLLDYPDLDQVQKLANAAEERILKYLDAIVEDGEYNPPDPFMDLAKATELCTQYYNLYVAADLEEEKAGMLRDFFQQIQMLQQATQPPAPAPGAVAGGPLAVPQAPPVSDMLPTTPKAG